MAGQSCIYTIHSLMDSFSAKERTVADHIVAQPSQAVHPSIEELAATIGVSVSTLLRFVKKLGYDGYQQFRIALATEVLAPETRFYERPVSGTGDAVASGRTATELRAVFFTNSPALIVAGAPYATTYSSSPG